MDGRGRWLDNVFIERLWRSLKYEEEVYLKCYADGREVARRDHGLDRVLQRHATPSGARRTRSDDHVADRDDG
jgi:hypothetical protein